MAAEAVLLRLASAIPAALGTWTAAALFLWIFRVRDATLRAALWTWAALSAALVAVGLPSAGLLGIGVVVPTDYPLFRGGAAAPAMLALWLVGAAWLVARRRARDRRVHACVAGVATISPPPADLVETVERTARWLGVAAPRIVACEADGTAFVAGVASPVLFVPLGLWRRLDARGRRALLLHEMAHVRRRDPLRLHALSWIVDLLWPALPLRWTAAHLRDAWESQADEEAVHAGATRSALARSLVAAWSSPSPAGVLAFGGAAGATARRLAALKRSPRAATLALQAAALVFCVPWCPAWSDGGVSFRMATGAPGERPGVVFARLGAGGDPLTDALLPDSVVRASPRPNGTR